MTAAIEQAGAVDAGAAQIAARLERLPISRWHVRARLVMGTATFFDAYNVLAIAYALPLLIRDFRLPPTGIGLLISSGFLGQFVGAILFGWLAERWGRLRVAALTIAIYAVMGVFCAAAWSGPALGLFRFLQGIGVGGEVPVAAAYINEFASAGRRGRFFILYEMSFSLGLLLAAILGYWLVPLLGWRIVFLIGAAPALLVIPLRRLLPESPRWLAERGRLAEADAVVSAIERDIERRGTILPPAAPAPIRPRQGPAMNGWRELVGRTYRTRSLLVWTFWVCSYFIGYGLTTWLPTLYTRVFHLPLTTALGYSLVTAILAMAGSLTCALTIDRVGRRRWYVIAFFAAAIPLFALWATGVRSAEALLWLSTASYFFIGSINISILVYAAELYPTRIRALGISVGSAWLRAASTIGPAVVGLVLAHYSIGWVFALFAAVSVVGGLVSLFWGIETKGRTLEELSP